MSSNNYLDTLGQLFSGSTPSKEKVLGLMDETLSFFREIKAKLESNDPSKQKEAYEETMEMKRILESQMKTLSEKTGLNLAELAALADDTNNMSPDERGAIEAAKAKLQQIQEEENPIKTKPYNNHKIIG